MSGLSQTPNFDGLDRTKPDPNSHETFESAIRESVKI